MRVEKTLGGGGFLAAQRPGGADQAPLDPGEGRALVFLQFDFTQADVDRVLQQIVRLLVAFRDGDLVEAAVQVLREEPALELVHSPQVGQVRLRCDQEQGGGRFQEFICRYLSRHPLRFLERCSICGGVKDEKQVAELHAHVQLLFGVLSKRK